MATAKILPSPSTVQTRPADDEGRPAQQAKTADDEPDTYADSGRYAREIVIREEFI